MYGETPISHGISFLNPNEDLTLEEQLIKLGLWPEEFAEAIHMDEKYSDTQLLTMVKEHGIIIHDGEKKQLIAALIIQKRSEGRPMEDKPISGRSVAELKSVILLFASQHGFAIDPAKDLNAFCMREVRMGHCVCVDSRLYCPCKESLEEVESQGNCTCHLFIRRDLYETAFNTAQYYQNKKIGDRFVPPKEKRGRR